MTNPCEHGFRRRAGLSRGWGKTRDTEHWRRSAAFVAAAAILLAGAFVIAGGLAWAFGGGRAGRPLWKWQPPRSQRPRPSDVQTHRNREATRANGLAVCVRLCDGFFFPSATSSGGDEACAAQCPDAPTARYTEPAGSDRIEEAVSTQGALYSALPVANRYQTASDDICRCHRSLTPDYSASVLNDPTLRKGDIVVTPKGLLVFQGAKISYDHVFGFRCLVASALFARKRTRGHGRLGARGGVATSSRRRQVAERRSASKHALTPLASAVSAR